MGKGIQIDIPESDAESDNDNNVGRDAHGGGGLEAADESTSVAMT